MAFFKGYKYTTKNKVIEAQLQCNEYYGIPINLNDVTKNWVDYQFAKLNDSQFYYIIYHDTLFTVLGMPIDFDVIIPKINF